MEYSFSCQFCLCKCNRLYQFKEHIFSKSHHQNVKGVFPNDNVKNVKGLPHIMFMDPADRHRIKHPIVGLSAMTLCFSPESSTSFYLCHICEEKCLGDDILRHLFSLDHYINYINCKHPNAMSFSWIPNTDMKAFLSSELLMILNGKGHEELQLVHLPQNLLEKHKMSTYSEVMLKLGENEKLVQLIQALKPERLTIQSYQKDSNRKHPLLGTQHLVECICVGPNEKRYYLCTLCSLTVGAHMIIKHILSFDHIFWYFTKWHPSTLLSKQCYTEYTSSFKSMILDLSQQAEEMYKTANTDMKRVSLEPAEFKSVNFNNYAEALKTLESIKKCSLKTDIKPGMKLEHRAHKQTEPAEMLPQNPKCRVLCQDCNLTLKNISHYVSHVSDLSHVTMLWKIFDGNEGYKNRVRFHLGLHSYVRECLKKKQPVIGAALIVSCITTEVEAEPFYMCFACRECVRQPFLRSHLKSRKHVIHTLLYENPWRLPFGWENLQDDQVLMSEAWKEEKERRPMEIVLKVLDVPFSVFFRITPPTFETVLDGLQQQHDVLKNEVPPCETYSKLQQDEPFPLLGMEFVVMHSLLVKGPDPPETGFLCLLCERRLSNNECYDHVFSHEHVSKFLDCFHPGSLKSNTDAATLLDLAKQAAKIHMRSYLQVVYLSRPIKEPCSYLTATHIMASLTRHQKNRNLKPPIRPGRKLVPRVTLKVEQDVRDDGQKTSSTSTVCVKNIKKEMPLPSEKDSESQRKGISQTEKMKSADDVCSAMNQKPKAANAKEPTGEKKSCHNEGKDHEAETGIEKSRSGKDGPTQLKNYKEMERKRPHSVSETSQKDPCPTGDARREMGEISHKRLCLTSREDSCEDAPKMSSIKIEEKEDEAYKAAMDKGLSALLKCCCEPHEPVYLCESCSLKISDKDIVSHLTGFDHHKVHLMNVAVNEDIYNNISKQSFQSAMQAVRAFQTQQDSGCERPSTLASPCVKTVDTSIDRHDEYTRNNLTVVKMEIGPDESSLFTATSKHTPASSQCPGTTCISKSSVSSTKPSAESADVCRTGAALRMTAASLNDAPPRQTESRVATEASCKTAASSKSENVAKPPPQQSKSKASPQVPSVTTCVRNSVGPNTPHCYKNNTAAAASTQAMGTPVRPEHKKPPPEPSQTFMTKTKPSEGLPKVGLNELIVVLCEEKRQVYCKLCSVKLTNSSDYHLVSLDHWKNYVKTKYPEWSAKQSEMEKKLNKIATPLAEAEKKLGSCRPQIVKVKKDLYEKLAHLPEDEAVRHVKAICQRSLRVSSASPVEAASFSPCDVSSSDDGINMQYNETLELSSTKHSAVENKDQHQTLLVQRQEMKSNLKVEADLAAGEPIRRQSSKSDETQFDLIQDELEIEEIAETVPLTNSEQDFEVQTRTEVMPAIQSSDVTMEKPCVSAKPADTDSELNTFAESPDGETCDHRPKGWKSEKFQDSQKLPGGTQKVFPVKFSCSEPLSVAAAGQSKGQNQLKHSQKMKHVPKHYPGPEKHSASQTCFKTPTGRRIRGTGSKSNLSIFLKMKGLDSEPLIGQDCVLECRGIALETFFLCMCCKKTISHRDICPHIVGFNHQLEYVRREFPQILNKFWEDKDITFEEKRELLKKVSWKLSEREKGLSPEVITLRKEMHKWVRTAPFSEALEILHNITNADKSEREEMVQDIKSNHKHSIFVPQSQRPDEGLSPKESLPTAQRVDRYQRNDNESRQTQEPPLERTATVSGLDVFKEKIISPLDVSCSSPKDDSVVSPLAHRFSCSSPQETCSKPPMQPQFTPPVSEHQWPVLSLHVKQEEEHSESPCSSTGNPNVSQTLAAPPRDERLPSKKRPADVSVKTLLTACTSNPLEDPLPAKSTSNQQRPLSDPTSGSVSQSVSVHSAAVPNSLSHHDEDTSAVDWGLFAHLITMLKGSRSQVSSRVETFGSCADSSSESVKTGWDSNCMGDKSELPVNKTRQDSECQLVKATVKKTPSSSSSFESVSLPGNHADTGCESQPVHPSGSSANILCSGDHLMTGNPTEVKAASAARHTATTAETRDPQHPQHVSNQNLFENMVQFGPSCSTDTSPNTGQMLQPHADSETDSTGAGQLSISTIVTNRATQRFMGHYQQQHHNEVNRVSFPTVPTANPTEFLVPSGRCDYYSQMPYVASGQPGYAPSEAVLGYTTADNPHAYYGTLNPNESYTAGTIYPVGCCPQLTVTHSSWQFGQAAVPPGWVSLDMQYYPSMMRR